MMNFKGVAVALTTSTLAACASVPANHHSVPTPGPDSDGKFGVAIPTTADDRKLLDCMQKAVADGLPTGEPIKDEAFGTGRQQVATITNDAGGLDSYRVTLVSYVNNTVPGGAILVGVGATQITGDPKTEAPSGAEYLIAGWRKVPEAAPIIWLAHKDYPTVSSATVASKARDLADKTYDKIGLCYRSVLIAKPTLSSAQPK